MKVKEESEKVGLKLSIQKTKIMASGPITSWQIDGETVERMAHFIFLGSKIIADGDCSHEIKRRLFLGIKAMTNLKEGEVSQLCLTLCDPINQACQASLSITNSWSLLKLMSIKLVMPSNHLILCHLLLLPPLITTSTRVFPNESVLCIRWQKYFLSRSKHLLISWLQSPSAVILKPPQIKSVTVFVVSPSICYEVMGPDAMILVFWMLSFKPTFSLSSFTFIKRLFSQWNCSLITAIPLPNQILMVPQNLCQQGSPFF